MFTFAIFMGGKSVYQITANETKVLTHFREYLKFVFSVRVL